MLHRTQTRVFSKMKFYAVDKQSQYIDKVCKLAELKKHFIVTIHCLWDIRVWACVHTRVSVPVPACLSVCLSVCNSA